jgi:hypothetical protein
MVYRARQMLAIFLDLEEKNDRYARWALKYIRTRGIIPYFKLESAGQTAKYPANEHLTSEEGKKKLEARVTALRRWQNTGVTGAQVRKEERERQASLQAGRAQTEETQTDESKVDSSMSGSMIAGYLAESISESE